jgi:26S proteasome regulatory subunit N2
MRLSEQCRFLAASLASKCYYHLEEYGDALRLALSSGPLFDVNARTEYAETLVARCIDDYIALRLKNVAAGTSSGSSSSSVSFQSPNSTSINVRIEAIVNRMFHKCWAEGAYKQAIGVAIETRRLDMVEETIRRASAAELHSNSDNITPFLAHAYELASLISSRNFRKEFLSLIVRLHEEADDVLSISESGESQRSRDHISLCKCLQSLNAASEVGVILLDLVRRGCGIESSQRRLTSHSLNPAHFANSEPCLLAFQIAFNIVNTEDQDFTMRVLITLPPATEQASSSSGATSSSVLETASGAAQTSTDETVMSSEDSATTSVKSSSETNLSPTDALEQALRTLRSILDGTIPSSLFLDFLSRHNKTDMFLLRLLKTTVEKNSRDNSILHHAILVAHGFMNCGTTSTVFLKQNMEWMGKAGHWSRFSTVASQGVVHKGHTSDAMSILASYLPVAPGAPSSSNYAEGGALYALGLIFANRGTAANAAGARSGSNAGADQSIVDYLSLSLQSTQDEVIQHGACLGLGLASIASGNDSLYGNLREVMFQDKAVAGEAAGLALGLILIGKGPGHVTRGGESVVTELLGQARDTQHDKIIRGIAIGLALMCYGLEEDADALIQEMSSDRVVAELRYGAMYAIGMAYAGTANNSALRKLLHVAVSDVSDDVRRAAVTNVGFILSRQPAEVPAVLGQLAESYNAHVRYGAAMALGIACAATGLPGAVSLLEPLLDDSVDFVRQGAYIALGLVLQLESVEHLPRVKVIRDRMLATISTKTETLMTKMGAILGLGIIDCGGRNSVISMISHSGFQKTASVAGLVVFLQHWYWFPFLHFLSLASSPTILAGIQGEMKIPSSYSSLCNCPPSWFSYIKAMEEKKDDKKDKVILIELSTAARAKAKAKAKGIAAEASATEKVASTDIPSDGSAMVIETTTSSSSSSFSKNATEEAKTAAAKNEPSFYYVTNPSRVTPRQQKFISIDKTGVSSASSDSQSSSSSSGDRYTPAQRGTKRNIGVFLLRDKMWGQPDATLIDIKAPSSGGEDEGPEPPMPKTFEWEIGQYF